MSEDPRWWRRPQFSWLDLLWLYLIVQVLHFISAVFMRPLGEALARALFG